MNFSYFDISSWSFKTNFTAQFLRSVHPRKGLMRETQIHVYRSAYSSMKNIVTNFW